MQHFFDILGCNPKSTPEEVRKAWRKKCREHHPDLGGDSEMFMAIMNAYKMITDPYYRLKENKYIKELTFKITVATDFEEAFFGNQIILNYNRIYFDHNLEQIVGKKIEPLSVLVKIPAGSTAGFDFIEKSKGYICGTQVGDAHITVAVRKHSRYMQQDIDVMCEENVPLDIMLKGGEITVETLWGHKVVWVSAGTAMGDKIRIPYAGVGQNGCQICTVNPIFPKPQELKENEAWMGLNINWEKVEKKNDEDSELMRIYEEIRKTKKS